MTRVSADCGREIDPSHEAEAEAVTERLWYDAIMNGLQKYLQFIVSLAERAKMPGQQNARIRFQ